MDYALTSIPGRNIGSRASRFDLDPATGPPDCTYSKEDPWDHTGTECFFTTEIRDTFGGWAIQDGTTHYNVVLSAYGF